MGSQTVYVPTPRPIALTEAAHSPAGVEAGYQLPAHGQAIAQEAERIAKAGFRRKGPVLIRSLDLIQMATLSSIKAGTLIATDQRLRDLGVLLKVSVLP